MTTVRLVCTSLGVNRLEHTHSERLKLLLLCKGVDYTIEDLAQESPGIRSLYKSAGKLFCTKRGNGQTSLPLPQLFVSGVYIGGYEEVQSLEDSGVLTDVLSGRRCPHVYMHCHCGYLMDSYFAFSYCPLCDPDERLILSVTEEYSRDETQFRLWRALLNSHERFSVKYSGSSTIHNVELTQEKLLALVETGDLRAVFAKDKCVKCYRKTIMQVLCAACKGTSLH